MNGIVNRMGNWMLMNRMMSGTRAWTYRCPPGSLVEARIEPEHLTRCQHPVHEEALRLASLYRVHVRVHALQEGHLLAAPLSDRRVDVVGDAVGVEEHLDLSSDVEDLEAERGPARCVPALKGSTVSGRRTNIYKLIS